ncbi:transposase [Ferrimicrobium sp.]|uniref:transposase n=1 Tax=Ferrimicrobium sp. TaxID=2926050 RepID=UPI00260E5BB5|nr:transposase [Ferrimicrobium sp.]
MTLPRARSSPRQQLLTERLNSFQFLELIDKKVPKELGVHIVLDNYAVHKSEPVRLWLLAHPRFEFHFTPTYSS